MFNHTSVNIILCITLVFEAVPHTYRRRIYNSAFHTVTYPIFTIGLQHKALHNPLQ